MKNHQKNERQIIYRHSLIVRLTHRINVLCLFFLLMSGLQIFNAHPRLYWGKYGADMDRPVIVIGSVLQNQVLRGYVQVGSLYLTTTGVLGVSKEDGEMRARAFPSKLTLPSWQDLGAGRHWHFFFAWLLVLNGLIYLLHGTWSGHFRRALLPQRHQLRLCHLWQEIINHVCLRFPKGKEARHYNVLLKITYLLVIFILLPLMVVTGLTMSPALDAVFPFLPELFGGRPSARTLHFILASLLVMFILLHLAMVLVSGVWNNLRAMISGRYAIEEEGDKR
ncbi:cytochrome b/b6 domain-containing protein [Klebsiella pneumoniae]